MKDVWLLYFLCYLLVSVILQILLNLSIFMLKLQVHGLHGNKNWLNLKRLRQLWNRVVVVFTLKNKVLRFLSSIPVSQLIIVIG